MPNDYVLPYLISSDLVPLLPEGQFIVPLCTTRERFDKIMSALWYYGQQQDNQFDFDHLVDFLDALPRIRAGCEFDVNDNCTAIFPNDERITWLPESPYAPLDEPPDGYAFHPFTIVDSSIISEVIAQFGLGFKIGDVFTDLTKYPFGLSWEDIFGGDYLGFPRMRINNLEGKGTVKLHLLNIRQGGRIMVAVNGVVSINPFANRLIETSTDWLSFPPETNVEQIVEVDIEQSGTNFLDVVWLPVVDNDFIPLFFGAGIRYIELCGFDMPQIDPCCPDEKDILVKIFQQNNTWMSYVYSIMDDGENPESFVPDAPDNYDSSDGDDNPSARVRALCSAVARYIWNVLTAVVEAQAQADQVTDIISQFPPFGIVFGLVDMAVDVSQDAIAGLVGDRDAVNDVICHMLANLTGQPLTQPPFRDSVDPSAFTPLSNQNQIAIMIDVANASAANWRAFTGLLPETYEKVAAGGSVDCPCDCDDDIELYDYMGTGTVITPVGECIYKFEQATPIFEGGSDRYYHSFRDTLGRCLFIEHSPDGLYPTEAVADYQGLTCDGEAIPPSVGGFGGEAQGIYWRGAAPTTHWKITLAEE